MIVIKIRIPEWVPMNVRKKMKCEIEDSMTDAINTAWGDFTPEIEHSDC